MAKLSEKNAASWFFALVAFAMVIATAGLVTTLTAKPAFASEMIEVTVDHAKVMRISRPAATIVIGNPGIADAAVQDETTLIITGKSFGVTNMIVLDHDGEAIAESLLTVRGERVNAV
ncbi:MAG: pilus assembly protein N-terminal domain-containing protein, partial [Pseudomonadota bacterium]